MTNEDFLERISEDGEEWRYLTVKGSDIAVSNKGRVVRCEYSIEAVNSHGFVSARYFPPKLLKQSQFNATKDLRRHGSYLTVTLGDRTNRSRVPIHKIVALAFLENPNNYPHIDHIDGNRENNVSSNLRHCTAKMNMNNPITKERIRESLTGKPSPLRIPVVAFVNGEPIKVYPSLLATKDDSYSPNRVYYCCEGMKPHHKGVQWKYLHDCPNLNINDVNVL